MQTPEPITYAASSLAIFGLGWSNTQWGPNPLPIPLAPFGLGAGCTGYTSLDGTAWLPAAGGISTYSLVLPNSLGLAGLRLFIQGASIDPALPTAVQMAVSNALRADIGI